MIRVVGVIAMLMATACGDNLQPAPDAATLESGLPLCREVCAAGSRPCYSLFRYVYSRCDSEPNSAGTRCDVPALHGTIGPDNTLGGCRTP